MTLKKLSPLSVFAALLLVAPVVGCSSDDSDGDDGADDGATGADDGMTGDGDDGGDDGMTGDDTGSDDAADDGGAECPGAGGAAAVGDACTSNGDCASGVCVLFGDVPTPDDAVCGELPADCNTRITATVYDFELGSRIGGIDVRVSAAIQASTNPAGATAIVEGTTDDNGQFDVTSSMPIMAAIGIVAVVGNADYFLTVTGVSSPSQGASYDVGNGNHELWAVSNDILATWSAALAMDKSIPAANLPLGDEGGVVGLVRSGASGDAVSRAVVVPESEDSGALVRYLADDGSWTTDGTGTDGIFAIMNPALAEEFHVEVDGATVSGTGTAGSAGGAIFTLIMNTDG